MKIEAYNDAEMQQRAHIVMTSKEREQLFRLKGYLEGIIAPKEMRQAFSDLLYIATNGNSIGPAVR